MPHLIDVLGVVHALNQLPDSFAKQVAIAVFLEAFGQTPESWASLSAMNQKLDQAATAANQLPESR